MAKLSHFILSSSLWQKMLALNKYGKAGRETKGQGQHMIKHYKKYATSMTLFALTVKRKTRKCNSSKYFHQNVVNSGKQKICQKIMADSNLTYDGSLSATIKLYYIPW